MNLLLAKPWTSKIDPTGWYASEKLDGVRAYWDGTRLLSRLGNEFHAPNWFLEGLPRETHLDGELWAGRGKFSEAVSAVKKKVPVDDEWSRIAYQVFDIPECSEKFSVRYVKTKEVVGQCGLHVERLSHTLVSSLDVMISMLDELTTLGAEGIMLRHPESLYERKRSGTLLKVKKFLDAEGTVIGHKDGEGKHTGRLGAYIVHTADGVEFCVGTGQSDSQREAPLPIGSLIIYRYQELTKDRVPRFPSFIGERSYE